MDISLRILITTCLVNLSILIIVLSKKAKGINNKSVIFFCLSLISLIFWSVCNYLADTSASVTSALFWTQASFPPALYMGLSILLFSYVFPISRPRNKITIPLYVILVVFFSLASMSSLIIKDVTIQHGIGVSDVTVGILYPGILILLLLLIIHPTYIFIKNIKTLQGKNKDQVKYVLLGWTTFLTFAVITNAILPLITGSAIWSKFGPLASVFMSASISYAIIRHEFLDIKIIIQRGLVYSLLLSIITAVYLFLIFTFEYFFHSDDGTMILISAFLTTLVGIVGVPPLKVYFQKITDPIFFKDTYDYATVLSELTDILNNNIVLDTIIEKTESTLLRALRVEHVTFSFTDTVLDGGGFSLPVTSNSKPLGTLYVGVKRSGDAFTREDISLLKTFTKQAGIALEKASLFKQVEDYAKTLEEKVEERTQEIVAIQKEQETMMLEISHGRLQTPLTIMKGELFLMRKQGHDNKRVDTIDASIDRISSFIYRFLSLTKLESAAIVPLSRLNLSSLLTQVILFFEQEAHEKGITLSGTISSDIFVTGIKEELEEMFSNLISNSIKYMRKDGPRGILITLSADKEKATITLSDDGIGIKEENLPNLFKKFYRVKEAETKGIQGTGLGLVICKKIIDKHNGTLHIESVFGEGSTFIITIPFKAN